MFKLKALAATSATATPATTATNVATVATPRQGAVGDLSQKSQLSQSQPERVCRSELDPEAPFRAALQLGALVLCQRCAHFEARPLPHNEGHCRHFNCSTFGGPTDVIDCKGYTRRVH